VYGLLSKDPVLFGSLLVCEQFLDDGVPGGSCKPSSKV
jgi:hypothetical protein